MFSNSAASISTRRSRRTRLSVEPLEGRALLSAGALDTTFGGTGMVSTPSAGVSSAIAVQPDLKVVVAGSKINGYFEVARYKVDGSLDSTFGSAGIVSLPMSTFAAHAQAVAVQPDGKILVAGDAYVAGKKNLTTVDWAIARLNTNGSLDTSFGGGAGYVLTNWQPPAKSPLDNVARAIVLQPNGQIVVDGYVGLTLGAAGLGLARYNINGSLDTTFGTGGKLVNTGIGSELGQSLAIDSTGRLEVVGIATVGTTVEMAVARYLPNGTIDSTFGTGGVVHVLPSGASGAIATSVGLQSTGRIVVYGQGNYASSYNLVPTLVRLNANGSLDSTFGSAGVYTEPRMSMASTLLVQPTDDKLIAVGEGRLNGVREPNFWVTRVLADGSSYDPNFGTNGLTEANFNLTTVYAPPPGALAPDGKIVISGATFDTARFLGDSTTNPQTLAISAAASAVTPALSSGLLALDSGLFAEPAGTHKRISI
jgi:uncharacterized delta-60 repeat protein